MEEPPETIDETASPATILARFAVLRMRYNMGALDAAAFNDVLNVFQFHDASGVLWTPGAQSGKWYRWDNGRWVEGTPPARLKVPRSKLGLNPDPDPHQRLSPLASAKDPNTKTCPKCATENTAKKFCTSCGTKLV